MVCGGAADRTEKPASLRGPFERQSRVLNHKGMNNIYNIATHC
jgi:hypothetical protein